MVELFDALEAADPEHREATLFASLAGALRCARDNQPFWKKRLQDIELGTITSRRELARLPVLRKSELPNLQNRDSPFGGLTATPLGEFARLFMSPGPIFEPGGYAPDWWGAARALFAAGLRRGDIVLNTFSYHLTPAGAMFESGAHALGCAVIPAGPGNTAQQLAAIAHYQPSAYVGTPDFLKILFDKAAEQGQATSIQRAVVSGAALPSSLEAEFRQRSLSVYQAYGTADLGIVAFEGDGPGLIVNEGIIVEIVRVGTSEPVAHGEVGEVVVTRLNPDYPLFRFATGDLSCVIGTTQTKGRTNMRIKGWLGRADQSAKVRGMFIHPEQIAAVAQSYPELGRLRLLITRVAEQDALRLLAEYSDESLKDPLSATFAELTKLRGDIEIVVPGSLPNDGKLIDDRR